MQILARLLLFLTGHWRLARGRIGDVRWHFSAGGLYFLAAGAVVALIVAVLCYRKTIEGLTLRARLGLGGLRLIALLALLVMASGAVCTVDVASVEKPRMLVLIDDSPSMTLPLGATSRAVAVEHALHDEGLLERLSGRFDVRIKNTSGRTPGAVEEDGLPQDLAQSLVRESNRRSDLPLSHILLLSDGVQLGSTELLRAAAELPAPVSALVVGDAKVTDVILQSVSVPPYVYHDDRALVTAEVRSLGYSGEATLQLYQLSGAGETQVADTHVTLKAGDEPAVARLQFVAAIAGINRYKLRVLPVPGELTDRNNDIIFHLDVRPEKIRVLFVEGSPSWEYKFIKQAFEKDPAIDFYGMVRLPGDEWLYQGASTRPDGKPVIAVPRGGFPGSADELDFFDVLIVGDLERKIFEQANRYEMLDSFVKKRAGGVVTLGGLQVYGAGDYAGTPLAYMLPFEIEKEKKQQLVNRFTPQITTQGLMHPAMQLEFDPVLNVQAWAKIPWVEGGNAIRQVKPSATLLMVHPTLKTGSGLRPIAAAWQYGAGRVLSTALDGTWHWRTARDTETDYHARYWGLVARWLASDPRTGKAAGSLVLEDPVMEVAKPATLSLSLHDKTGAPITDADADFTIVAPSAKTVYARGRSDPSAPGRYALTFTPMEAGEYIVRSATARPGDQPLKQEGHYRVGPSRAEFLDPRPDPQALANLASAAGGTSGSLADHAKWALPAGNASSRVQHVLMTLWQSPALMIIALAALSLEWLLRKRRGLS
ncbi:MAG TPA: hypothetical protein VG326_20705 [Tepidisphaeraceae bacterium]|jgi:uncharacterized membrane protein|nr:hypothetical protein [Tepidisphaeraceae bacterium]